jgi:mannitol/fructose-specific phosphotransferase system IIA component (Ntr-type)
VIIAKAYLIDLSTKVSFEEVVHKAAAQLSQCLSVSADLLTESFMQGTRVGATPVSHGVALPHLRLPDISQPEMIIVRAKQGVYIDLNDVILGEHTSDKPVYAFFFLVSSEDNPGQHLRILAQIAGHVDDDRFMKHWLAAGNEQEMKELLLRDERYLTLLLRSDLKTAPLIDRAIRDLNLPQGSLIALIRRGGEIIIPRGSTVLQEGDRLTIIGEPMGIQLLNQKYGDENIFTSNSPH